jgi:hypothetical protein
MSADAMDTEAGPSNPPPTSRSDIGGKGMVRPATAAQSEDNLAMPHERDQEIGQVAPKPDPVIQQASKDMEAGQVDTDMRATPGLDAARRARMVSTPQADNKVGSDPQRAAASTGIRRQKRGQR